MDLNIARAIMTVLSLVSFVGIAVWAYGGARRQRFDEASRLPLEEYVLDQSFPDSTSQSEGR